MARSPSPPSRSAAAPVAADPPPSYEAALAELDTLVSGLESGQWPLDRLLDGYRRGAELLAYCREQLQAVEQQVQVLEADQLKPWKDA
ncbi:exodeoxyribonuclease VII small subunit [Aquariibacter albus]|uniref:Exodeoxyribonuclease 7 small subunit n=1 Tax=Aquariibacter albus TaxID=2759899 RepID=A0A839HM76_9BURK|nr:exodeoxyribonuclease VII small subunit [Aquariibacter albus]MBB1160470.1 exodeoxyribonuclease VII small subunit [Aquariibacter albus]